MDEFRGTEALPDSYADCMSAGIRAAEQGQRPLARSLFRKATELDPDQKDAWLWLAGLSPDPRETIRYLQKALDIDPDDEAAREGMRWASQRLARQALLNGPKTPAPERPASAPQHVAKSESRRALWTWLAAAAVLLIVVVVGVTLGPNAYDWVMASARPTATPTPTNFERIDQWRDPLEDAWREGNWTMVITILERIRSLEPNYGGLNDWLVAAYTNYGRSLITLRRWDQARRAFETALEIQPGYSPASDQFKALEQYLHGVERLSVEDWAAARQSLQTAYEIDPGYPDVQRLLYEACYRHGLALQESGDLLSARDAYEAALAANPGAADAQARLAEVNYILTPPTPTPTPIPPKEILVDISEQRMYVYEGETLIWKWVCSTGEPGRPTRVGAFAVQSKIEEAYSSVWRLRMPYWLGIYWAGASENGIHALPINPNGTILWSGFLGYQVSYGCIILDTPNAKTLYDWAEVGTPVVIQP